MKIKGKIKVKQPTPSLNDRLIVVAKFGTSTEPDFDPTVSDITLTVRDSDGAEGSVQMPVKVENVPPNAIAIQ